jgi:hypothetical protein
MSDLLALTKYSLERYGRVWRGQIGHSTEFRLWNVEITRRRTRAGHQFPVLQTTVLSPFNFAKIEFE